MIRGTTPTISLAVTGINLVSASKIRVTLTQIGTHIVKEDAQIQNDGLGNLYIVLSQAETLELVPGKVQMQIKILMSDQKVYSSEILELTVKDAIDNEVI